LRTGTRTSLRNTSQKGEAPLMSRIGRGVTPGVSMSISRKVMPLCFASSKSVRTRMNIQSALSPYEVQIFCPFTTKSSPSRRAFVCRLARSEPAPGSE
jgi:hypothetical protein